MTGNDMVLCSEPRNLTVRGLEVEIMSWFYRDTDGEQYTDTEKDELNLEQVYDQLFSRYGVARPAEEQGDPKG